MYDDHNDKSKALNWRKLFLKKKKDTAETEKLFKNFPLNKLNTKNTECYCVKSAFRPFLVSLPSLQMRPMTLIGVEKKDEIYLFIV